MQRPRLKFVYFYGHRTKGVNVSISAGCSSCNYNGGFKYRLSLYNYKLNSDLFLWHKTRTNFTLPLNYLHSQFMPKKTTRNLTSLANSCRVLKLMFPPKPLRRPTINWPLSVTASRCDRPLNIVPTTLVSTTKSFFKKQKKVKYDFSIKKMCILILT